MKKKAQIEEWFWLFAMKTALFVSLAAIGLIILIIIIKGSPGLSISLVTEVQKSEYYTSQGGGLLNAISGSLLLAGSATILALFMSFPVAMYLNQHTSSPGFCRYIRVCLNILYGIPTVVVGAFVFLILLSCHSQASAFWGIIALTLIILPIIIRTIDELMQSVPRSVTLASYGLGASSFQTLSRAVIPQIIPGIIAVAIIGFGRAIGDAASILFTAGYSSSIPSSLFDPVASLPLAIYFQINSPFPLVQQKAYTAALILLFVIIIASIISRMISQYFSRYVIK